MAELDESFGLPPDIRAWLAEDFTTSLERNGLEFIQKCEDSTRDDWPDICRGFLPIKIHKITKFELANRLRNTIEWLDWRIPDDENDENLVRHITTVLNCEFLIYRLNAEKPLRENAFLKYWVEASMELTHRAVQIHRYGFTYNPNHAQSPRSQFHRFTLQKARLAIITRALTAPDALEGITKFAKRHFYTRSPAEEFQIAEESTNFTQRNTHLQKFIFLLASVGIRELNASEGTEHLLPRGDGHVPEHVPGADVETGQYAAPAAGTGSALELFARQELEFVLFAKTDDAEDTIVPAGIGKAESERTKIPPITPRTTLEDIELALLNDPQEITNALGRLPIDLTSLELLTNVLTSPYLARTTTTALQLTCSYLQHSLRTVEGMAPGNSHASDSDASTSDLSTSSSVPGGKDEQIRAMGLLCLFLRNLLRRGVVTFRDMYFDLEEIRVRYIWIKEVREFRKFLDELNDPSVGENNVIMGG